MINTIIQFYVSFLEAGSSIWTFITNNALIVSLLSGIGLATYLGILIANFFNPVS
ncbi:MAG: hypothetical protein MJ214_05570 [Bacilli bacterium]|nr:hypothetical protein [Bacilli bacterium]